MVVVEVRIDLTACAAQPPRVVTPQMWEASHDGVVGWLWGLFLWRVWRLRPLLRFHGLEAWEAGTGEGATLAELQTLPNLRCRVITTHRHTF